MMILIKMMTIMTSTSPELMTINDDNDAAGVHNADDDLGGHGDDIIRRRPPRKNRCLLQSKTQHSPTVWARQNRGVAEAGSPPEQEITAHSDGHTRDDHKAVIQGAA